MEHMKKGLNRRELQAWRASFQLTEVSGRASTNSCNQTAALERGLCGLRASSARGWMRAYELAHELGWDKTRLPSVGADGERASSSANAPVLAVSTSL